LHHAFQTQAPKATPITANTSILIYPGKALPQSSRHPPLQKKNQIKIDQEDRNSLSSLSTVILV